MRNIFDEGISLELVWLGRRTSDLKIAGSSPAGLSLSLTSVIPYSLLVGMRR